MQAAGSQSSSEQLASNADAASAPKNVSISKVAQGYVINWQFSASASKALHELAAAAHMQQQAAGAYLTSASTSSSAELSPAGGAQNAFATLFPAASVASSQHSALVPQSVLFATEFRERSSRNWQTLPLTPENSQLLKDLRPGVEYLFRVVAFAKTGTRSAPSAEVSYLVPGK